MSELAGVAITTVLSILAIVDILGNTLVCLIIKRNRDMRIHVNYLLLNLAVADILFGTFFAPRLFFKLTGVQHPDGMTGTILCKLLTDGTVGLVGAASSVVTLVAIAIERYYAVVYPLGNKGELIERYLKGVIRVRKRVTLMVVAITAIFGICWGTASVVYVLHYVTSYNIGPVPLAITNTMVLSNSAVNPFVYALLNQQFKEKMKKMICCIASSRVHPTQEPQVIEIADNTTHPTHAAGPCSTE
ncbi:hypothetical protein ACROYT_G038854 [Oculina patagonica]